MSGGRTASLANLERRAAPFEAGNDVALKHGVQAVVGLQSEVERIAEWLRRSVPGFIESDELAVRLVALNIAQVFAGVDWLSRQEDPMVDKRGRPWPVLDPLRRAQTAADKGLRELGLTPAARRQIVADIASARSGTALAEHLARVHGVGT